MRSAVTPMAMKWTYHNRLNSAADAFVEEASSKLRLATVGTSFG